MPDPTCLPYWSTRLAGFAEDTRKVTDAAVDAQGFVTVPPETLRAQAQSFLRQIGKGPRRLSIDTYTLARNIRSEYGQGTPEAKVAIAEVAVNEARRRGKTITELLLANREGKALYGKQTQGRFASTVQDPTVGDVLIADFVLRGKSGNFVEGATKYLSPDGMGSRLWEVLGSWMSEGFVWVGHLPNVPTRKLFVLRKAPKDRAAEAMNSAGLDVLEKRVELPVPVAICAPPPNNLLRVAGIGLASAAVVAATAFFLNTEVLPQKRVREWPA